MHASSPRTFHWILLAGSAALLVVAVWIRTRDHLKVPAPPRPVAVAEGSTSTSSIVAPITIDGPTVTHRPRGDAEPDVAALTNQLRLTNQEVIRQRGDALAYNSDAYGATVEKGRFRIAVTTADPKERPWLDYELTDVRVGGVTIATGGEQPPSIVPGALGSVLEAITSAGPSDPSG